MAEIFKAGDIDFRAFQTIVYRSDLITDRDVLAAVDAQLAAQVTRWPSMTRSRLAGQIDKIVAKADADAVRRRQGTPRRARGLVPPISTAVGTSHIHGSLLSPDAHALDKQLDGVGGGTPCASTIPATGEQRRADDPLWRHWPPRADRTGLPLRTSP